MGQEFRWGRSSASWGGAARRLGHDLAAPPRRNGGNIDNKELVAGTTLYLPIFVEGALFSAATAMACKATARSASPRSRPA